MPSSEGFQPSPQEREALAEAERNGIPFLILRNGEGRQQVIALPEGGRALSVGRGAWMDVALPWDDQTSRLHAQLERLGDDWTVVDDGLSRNGTYLNEERVQGRRRLRDGDQLRFGTTTVEVRIPSDEGEQPTAIAPRPEL